jgi:hypothetical protein
VNKLTMTRELIADMLGVRREGVTEARATLPASGRYVRYRPDIRPILRQAAKYQS